MRSPRTTARSATGTKSTPAAWCWRLLDGRRNRAEGCPPWHHPGQRLHPARPRRPHHRRRQGMAALYMSASERGLRGYVFLGEQDDTVPHDEIRTIVSSLNDHGIPCELEMVPAIAHDYPARLRPLALNVLPADHPVLTDGRRPHYSPQRRRGRKGSQRLFKGFRVSRRRSSVNPHRNGTVGCSGRLDVQVDLDWVRGGLQASR